MAVFSGLACWCRYSTVNIYAFIWLKLITDLHLMQLGNHEVCNHRHTLVTGHGNMRSYLYKYKIIVSPTCSCKKGEQTIDRIIYDCELVERERKRLKAAVLRTEKWPISKDILINKYSKTVKKFTESITFDKL